MLIISALYSTEFYTLIKNYLWENNDVGIWESIVKREQP